ncbi:MAG: adenylate/guanylate cyclase domain-containing protein [Smithellaceae bacterium]|nr:adenylate/guanylate cyclase domain-containing protein [Smithellaceae bacterium]
MTMKDKPVILVVDDQPQNIELLEAYLVPQGYEIVTAVNGEEALEKLSGNKIDLILLDVMMPGMNGYEVCKKIKSDSDNAFLPIVMLTALDNRQAKIQGLEAGADDFLNKPYSEIELVARIKNLLKIKFLHDEVESKNHLISSMLHRYVNRFVIEQILANPEKYSELGGDRKEVAAFFCDIRGFTSLSENMKADELIHLLNSIYKKLTETVFRNKGTFDKYMGDCIMAFWGAPMDIEDETLWAIRAALEMQVAFEDLKQGWPPELKKLGIGIGINYGEVVVGNVGTEEAMNYTVIGDVVNTAQRLESIARSGQVLITKNALLRVEGKIKIRALQPGQLKGKSLPVEIYEVLKMEKK